MPRLAPHFHDLELGLSADDIVADLRNGLAMPSENRR